MDTNGSIKASGIKGSSFRPTQIEPALLATAKQFLENFQFDTRVRQMLHEDKLEQSVGKHKYYIMKGHPIVFLHSRFQYGFALRMRLHASLYQKQALLIGTLDTVFATFRLEDVWFLNGTSYYTEPYSKRYEALQTFFSTMFVQDKHLSGFNVELAKLAPLSDLRKIVDSKEFNSVDFVPEHGGRRRWHLPLAFTQQQKKIADAPFNAKGPEKTLVEAASIPVPTAITKVEIKPTIPDTKFTEAIARKIVGMPDTYSLQSKTNLDLGRGAVQTSGLSMLLRSEFTSKKRESVGVSIQWYEEFQRYKITGILEN
ncbi:MAG: hypothetical protein EBU82_07500 [Flavobacteriia bacterium]|nr:hypothetical protein [Flavobacteriia bacterium]